VPTSSPAAVDRRRADLDRFVGAALRHRWWILAGAALLFSLRAIGHGHGDWDFFVAAGRRLLGEPVAGWSGPGGLHLYATSPDVVTGPLTLLGVRAVALAGGDAGYAVGVVATNLLAVVGIAAVERAAALTGRARPATTLVGGIVVLVAWSELAAYGHVDDAVALVAVTVALWAIARGEPAVIGLALGIAVASKQWGVMFLPLALAVPGRDRLRSAGVALAVSALAWLPFVFVAPSMLEQRGLSQIVADDSVFAVFDYPRLEGPTWVRVAQLAVGLVLVGLCVWRHRWAAAILVAVAARVALDPATWSYYTAGVVLGAFAWDALGTRRVLPAWTIVEFLLLSEATVLVDDPTLRGVLRLLACATALGALVLPREPARARSTGRAGPPQPPG
jgi:hypothetical protein